MGINNIDWNEKMKIEQIRKSFLQMPARMGNIAERHFKDSFRLKGFDDNGLQPWPGRKRQGLGSLMIVTGSLKRSIRRASMTSNSVTIVAGDSKVNYAQIHNEGGTTHPTVTAKMLTFAHYMAQKSKSKQDAQFWNNLSHTSKSKLTVPIPQRKFMGPSASLDRKTVAMITNELNKLFK